MRKNIIPLFLAAIFCSGAQAHNLTGIPPVEYQIELSNETSEFFTIEVKGTPYERGVQHGKALRKVIRPTLNRFKYDMVSAFLKEAGTDYNWSDYRQFFFNNTGLFQTAQKEAPELVEEIKGIAHGANLDFKDVFIYNLNFDETFWVLEKMTGVDPMLASAQANKDQVTGHCSHGSVWADGKASVGYTLDWTRHFEGSQALIKHILDDGTVLLTTTYAGTLIGHGINASNGYTFTPHSKFQLAHDVDSGLAQIFIYRKLLEAGSVDKAISLLEKIKPAAGLAYTLTDKNGTRTFEVSSNHVAEVITDGQWMAVANVARVNNDLSASYREALKLSGQTIDMNNLPSIYWQYNEDSVIRYNMISKAIRGKTPEEMTPGKWEALFSKQPINKPVDEKVETSNLWHVVDIDDEYIEYHVSPGNPGNIPMESYRFKYQ
ncbi:C45 family autoproteolytic acyltransferase/hydolase [Endozoicomonas atrinae]|uniref:C45 family autoproteolytic acyltransferase/hydolase n=1 Tax=Endozoicomonas atrinae TaxID=1333660 RepID=UPI0008263730|nr:C45 family peptidase [Endozoicomonas atrinae]